MKGLVFFDLDGTLLNQHSQVSEDVIIAIQQLKHNGYEPLLATGRSPVEVEDIMAKTGIQSGVFMNGQVMMMHGKNIIEHHFPLDTLSRFHAFTQQYQHGLVAYNPHYLRMVEVSPIATQAYGYIHSLPPAVDTHFYQQHTVTMLLLLAEPGHDIAYHQAFPELDFFRNSPYAVDIVLHGHSKATGIRELCAFLKQEELQTFAFGDGPNDIAMFKQVDVAIAMGNAVDGLKEIADFITTSHSESGIVNGLRHYHLIGDEE